MAEQRQYDDTNKGTLFLNSNKQNERAPDWSGPVNVNGMEKRCAAWLAQTKAGKVLRLVFSDPQPRQRYQATGRAYTPMAQQAAAQAEEQVMAVGPNGKAMRMARSVAQGLNLEILPEAPTQHDGDTPW